jgi:hypothetical protein
MTLYYHREHDAADWSGTSAGESLLGRIVLAALRERSRHNSGPTTNRRRRASDQTEDDRNPYTPSHDLVRRYAPRTAPVCVVSKGDEMAVHIRGHSVGWHFPQAEDGTYAGYHPSDAREAISHLEQLRDRGAQLFLVPSQFLWWLSHYTELREHLERSYARVPSTEEEGALFDLRVERLLPPSVHGREVKS